ncbi:unnamed protein product [Allacma fusca]|uniref:Uncharacterized protein n=1 Tax=Allacma fusca TaxID=39272 RepID=A0A8J2JS80_9HEXA|nr:unnamed protein product [Allacma fusca]
MAYRQNLWLVLPFLLVLIKISTVQETEDNSKADTEKPDVATTPPNSHVTLEVPEPTGSSDFKETEPPSTAELMNVTSKPDGEESLTTTPDTGSPETTHEPTPEPEKTPVIDVLFTYEDEYHEKLIKVALDYLRSEVLAQETSYNIGRLRFVHMKGQEPIKLITLLCKEMDSYTPDLVVDLTKFGIPSESVKVVTRSMQVPTVSASVGQPGDIREWRNLKDSEVKYLIQVSPPTDNAIQVVRSLAIHQKFQNLVIMFDDGYEMFHHHRGLLKDTSTRHIMIEIPKIKADLKHQLVRLKKAGYKNFFVATMELKTIEFVLECAQEVSARWKAGHFFHPQYTWYSMAMTFNRRKDSRIVKTVGTINEVFHIDLVIKAILAVGLMKTERTWPIHKGAIQCSTYKYNSYPELELDLVEAFKAVGKGQTLGQDFVLTTNGWNHVDMTMTLHRHGLMDQVPSKVANWHTTLTEKNEFAFEKIDEKIKPPSITPVYRVVTVIQPPFVYLDKNCKPKHEYDNCYYGYSIDLLNKLREILKFNYTIFHTNIYGFMGEKLPHEWDGMVKILKYQEADIAVGAISVFPEREAVMDFTYPVYELVGFQILMKKEKSQTSLFKFLTVLENDVWMCILGAYFFTSVLMWVFDRWSPYSFQNNREKYEDDEEKREFTLKECLWFCMTSLTPQGGGEAPKNLSGRLVAATWWLFGFIIIASYTANLAAFLTVSRLDAPIESLEDLIKQYKVQYAPVTNSSTWWHFDRMAHVEHQFYEAWKDMSLNDSLSDFDRSVLAVWEYPVSDKYTKIWQAILENGPPPTAEDAVVKVRSKEVDPNSDDQPEDFAWLGEATEIQYTFMTTCGFRVVGNQFAMNPYAFGVQKGSPLKQVLSKEIRQLEHLRFLENLKYKWWDRNPNKVTCSTADDVAEGISIHNIGGVFVVILVGFLMTFLATILEFWSYWRKNIAFDLSEAGSLAEAPSRELSAAFGPVEKAEFHAKYSENPGSTSPMEY